jgi:hypothetical protein
MLATRVGHESAEATESDAAHAARGADLLRAASAFATAQEARRVMSVGRDWQFTGQIVLDTEALSSRVAVPYRAQTNGGPWIVATELLEALVLSGHAGSTLALAGRMTKSTDGLPVVVLTSWRVINS